MGKQHNNKMTREWQDKTDDFDMIITFMIILAYN